LIGEGVLNRALHSFFIEHKLKPAPFPTSSDLKAIIITATPIELRAQVDELLSDRIIYDASVSNLRVIESESSPNYQKESFDVTVDVSVQCWQFDGAGLESLVDRSVQSKLVFFDSDNQLILEIMVSATSQEAPIAVRLSKRPVSVRIDPDYLLLDKSPTNNTARLK
jgi:hypothetical protein